MRTRAKMPPILASRGYTKRKWQQEKRQQVKEVKRRLDDLQAGCYFTPCCDQICEAIKKINECEQAMSVANWKAVSGNHR